MKNNFTILSIRIVISFLLPISIYLGTYYENSMYFSFFQETYYINVVIAFLLINSFFDPIKNLITKQKEKLLYISDEPLYYIFLLIFMLLLISINKIFDASILSIVMLIKYTGSEFISKRFFGIPTIHKTNKSNFERKFFKGSRYVMTTLISISFVVFFYGAYISTYPLCEFLIYTSLALFIISDSKDTILFVSFMLDQVMEILRLDQIHVRNKHVLEEISKCSTIVFNKGDVLTSSEYKIKYVKSSKMSPKQLLHIAAYSEYNFDHPIATAIKKAAPPVDPSIISNSRIILGHGVCTTINKNLMYVGNYKLMCQMGFSEIFLDSNVTLIHVASADTYLGCIGLEAQIEPTAKDAISQLKNLGITSNHLVTGDRYITSELLGNELGIDNIHNDLLLRDKISLLETLLKENSKKNSLVFVGGNTSDYEIMTKAPISIFINSKEKAFSKYQVVTESSDLTSIPKIIYLSKRALVKSKRIIFVSISLKILSLALVVLSPFTFIPALISLAIANVISNIICKRK